MKLEPRHMELSFANGFEEDSFKEIAEDFHAGGIHVSLLRRPPEGPWACLDWLIPTAVILLVAKPYFEGFFTETGKLHTQGFHKALSKLWTKVFGPTPEIRYTVVVVPRGKRGAEVFSHAFSIRSTRKDGGEAVLLMPSVTSSENFSLAAELFIKLMGNHHALDGTDSLTRTSTVVPYLNHGNFPALIYMNPETRSLELIDYVRSSQTQQLTTYRIEEYDLSAETHNNSPATSNGSTSSRRSG